jgi:hypothetical protein
VTHLPIIQLLGDNGPEHFKKPELFGRLYVAWAVKYGFDGYLIDAEFKGDDSAFVVRRLRFHSLLGVVYVVDSTQRASVDW